MSDWEGNTSHALYEVFRIEDHKNSYSLVVGGYSGDAGNSCSYYFSQPSQADTKFYNAKGFLISVVIEPVHETLNPSWPNLRMSWALTIGECE